MSRSSSSISEVQGRSASVVVLLLAALASGGVGGCAAEVGPDAETEVAQSDQALRLGGAGNGADKCTRDDDKVRICHFTDHLPQPRGRAKRPVDHAAKIIEVSERALPAHLAHGDGLAPPSVQIDADCLVPQPPPNAVSVSAVTGEDGLAQFVVPETNIRVIVNVADQAGEPLENVTTTLLASGSDYLIMAHEEGDLPLHAPAFVEGNLMDARPGSAPTLKASLVMQAFTSTFPGWSLLQPAGSVSQFVLNQFTSSARCYTREEFESHVKAWCDARFATYGTDKSQGSCRVFRYRRRSTIRQAA